MQMPSQEFLDVHSLLESSHPRPRVNWFWYGVGIFALVVMIASYVSSKSQAAEKWVDLASVLLMLGIGAAMATLTMRAVARQRSEHQQVEAIEELVQLRRWDQAGMMIHNLLSHPTRMPQARVQALIYLTSVLARYHRFDDAIEVQNYLIEHHFVDPGTEYGLRLGRAMAQLRQDHLVDANQSISELRRAVGDQRSGGLTLVEIYRDVRTGHPAEAIELFHANLDVLREQLGHRVADAYALTACACDQLDRRDEAQKLYTDATTLVDPAELNRRYPETNSLSQKYTTAAAPAEVA